MFEPGGECTAHARPAPPLREVRPPVLETLRLLEPGIAVVTNRLGGVLARTSAYESVTAGTGLLDTDAPDLTRYVFTDPRARTFFADWDAVADEQAFDLWLAPSVENSEWLTAELAPVAGPAADEETSQALARLRDLPPHGRLRAIS
ncbi:MmyB family transcriptional regulator [Streptomyces sp. NBC_01685]|uniref:MmyB family transcriptional regulator n=1 Tax=unclassified Streptomyces TaxID=2593676 RepID=UPI003FCE693D